MSLFEVLLVVLTPLVVIMHIASYMSKKERKKEQEKEKIMFRGQFA